MWVALALATVVNGEVIRRLRRRKRKGHRPIYPDSWYIAQLGYGIGLVLLLAIALPSVRFMGTKVGPLSWEGSAADLMGLQLLLGCALAGLRWGPRALAPVALLVLGWYLLCTSISTGEPDFEYAISVTYWASIDVVAGVLGRRVLTRMKEVGDAQEDLADQEFRGSILPDVFTGRRSHASLLTEEVASVLADRLPTLEQAVKRVAPSDPGVAEAWKDLTMQGQADRFQSLRRNFSVEAARLGTQGELSLVGLDVLPLSLVEEACVESFLHVVLANLTPPRAAAKSVSALVDVDRAWLRARAVIHGQVWPTVPSDGLFHSVGALRVLTDRLGGRFAIVRTPDVGEVIDLRIPRIALEQIARS